MVKITMIGHATLIFDFGNIRVLSDPCLSSTMGMPWFMNPYRRNFVKTTLENLQDIDAIVCTHRHSDHFEMGLLKRMNKNSTVFVPEKRMAEKLAKAGFKQIIEIRPWEEKHISDVTIAATPAIEGAQGLPQVGYILKGNGRSIYFGGDTMTFPEIEEIGRRFKVDVALPPINGVRFFGKQADMTPHDAAEAVIAMNAKVAIPQHYDLLFGFPGNLIMKAPGTPEEFAESVRKKAGDVAVKIIGSGETVEV